MSISLSAFFAYCLLDGQYIALAELAHRYTNSDETCLSGQCVSDASRTFQHSDTVFSPSCLGAVLGFT
jgi:hypothetical protein